MRSSLLASRRLRLIMVSRSRDGGVQYRYAGGELARLPLLIEGGRDDADVSCGGDSDRPERGTAGAQYARPIEVAPLRPVAPASTVITPSSGVVAPTPPPSAPTITNPPPAVADGGTARPRKCWCYLANPVTNSRQRSTCEVSCCKGAKQDERC